MSNVDGLFPICGEMEPFTVNGKSYRFGHLSMPDGFALLSIVNSIVGFGFKEGTLRLESIYESGKMGYIVLLTTMFGLPYVEELAYRWLAPKMSCADTEYKTPLTIDDLKNPLLFPLDAMLDIVENLGKHPGLLRFFERLSGQKNNPLVAWTQSNMEAKLNPTDGPG